MRSRIVVLMLVCLLFAIGSVSAFAATEQSPDVEINAENYNSASAKLTISDGKATASSTIIGIKAPITRKWTIQSTERVGYANISAKTFYDKDSANAAGERFTYEVTKTRSGSISGELKVSYATLEAKLGFDYSEKTTLSKSKTTKALAKGEVVKVYYQTRDHKYKVVQKGTRTGLEPIYRTLYVYKPAQPKIIFEYSK